MHTLVKLEHEFHNKSNEYAKYKKAYNIACPLGLPQVDSEASERLAAAKLRGARSTGFACKNIHLIKIFIFYKYEVLGLAISNDNDHLASYT